MLFQDIYPQEKLKEYIYLYRLRHFIIPPELEVHPKPYPARPEQCIAFYPRGIEISEYVLDQRIEKRGRAVISGQFTQRLNRKSLYSEFLIIMVVFKPGVLYRLTGIPFYELQNKTIDLEEVYPVKGREINELLSGIENYSEMIQIIEDFVWDLVKRSKIASRKSDSVFEFMVCNYQKYSIDRLASEACLSSRQFERKAYQYIGVCPKQLIRLSRFARSYWMKLENPALDWLSIAIYCGYEDYQHLVKDYRQFANTTPNLFFSEESKSLERALGLNK